MSESTENTKASEAKQAKPTKRSQADEDLRNLFAQAAIQGMCAAHNWSVPFKSKDAAASAYVIADAMMEAK